MAHARSLIRDAVALALTGLATTSSRVSVDPLYDLEAQALPSLRIQTGHESVDTVAQFGRRTYERTMSLSIEGVAHASTGLANTLDAMTAEIEIAMAADVTFGGVCMDAVLQGLNQSIERADQPVGKIALEYAMKYVTEL